MEFDPDHKKTQWQRFENQIAKLNDESGGKAQYKVLYSQSQELSLRDQINQLLQWAVMAKATTMLPKPFTGPKPGMFVLPLLVNQSL
jgi:hypothetical protein